MDSNQAQPNNNLPNQKVQKSFTPVIIFTLVVLVTVVAGIFAYFTFFNKSNIETANSSSTSSSSVSSLASSVQSQNSSTSQSSSTQSQTSSGESSTVSQGTKALAYTNEFFPNFKIAYDESWNFATSISGFNLYKNLAERSTTLSKGNAVITFYTGPIFPTGCAGPENIDNPDQKFSNGYNRYNNNGNIIYSRSGACNLDNIITTNIKTSDHLDYKEVMNTQDEFVRYNLGINVKGISNNDPILTEIDKIIEQSIFN
jgi:hypothetical protein